MVVTFTPPLMDQIRTPGALKVVIVRANGGLVERVDPVTRQCAGEPQQFLLAPDGRLTILQKSDWIADPEVLDVARTRFH